MTNRSSFACSENIVSWKEKHTRQFWNETR